MTGNGEPTVFGAGLRGSRCLLHELETDRGMSCRLGRCTKHRPDSKVVDGLRECVTYLLGRVGRQPDQEGIADHHSYGDRRQIFLPHMNTGCSTEPGDVRTVVHDDDGVMIGREGDDLRAQSQILTAACLFGPDLEESRAPRQAGARQIGHRPPGGLGNVFVEDRVESRQLPAAITH